MSTNVRTPDIYRLWGYGEFAHICFESPGCRFHKAGYCVMCDYGAGQLISTEQAVMAVKRAFAEWNEPIKRILLGTCGSIFDESEMPYESLFAVIGEIAKTDVESVIFETHYSTVKPELLQEIVSRLPEKKIAIELGFESSDPDVLKYSLHKCMNLDELIKVIALIHKFNISPILNVFLGAPGLNTKDQLADALRSTHWAYEHGADEVVIFPANVKPGTVLWKLLNGGMYEIPSGWLLVEMLQRLPDKELEATSISWYGDRQYYGVDMDVIPPQTCEKCRDKLINFFFDFMKTFSASERRKLLRLILNGENCDCRKQLIISL